MRYVRWLVPTVVVATVTGGVAVGSAAADDAPAVPTRTAAQVLALATTSRVNALTGTVSTTADLGLPALPAPVGGTGDGPRDGTGTAADPRAVLIRLLSGRSTLRVWLDGAQRQRVQLLDPFAEIAYVHDGRDVWMFDTAADEGTHVVLPDPAGLRAAARRAHAAARGASGSLPSPTPDALPDLTPQALAQQVLDRLDATTQVSLGEPTTVAGHAAYRLVVTPRTDGTLVDRAVLAVDARTGLPLRVQVFARGHADPALESGFQRLDYARPAAERFRFTAPAGADVRTVTVPAPDGLPSPGTRTDRAPGTDRAPDAARPDVRVLGSGWTSVVEVSPGADAAALLGDPLVAQATTAVDGGRAVRTRLVSVLLTDDGRVLFGAVPVRTLVAAAG